MIDIPANDSKTETLAEPTEEEKERMLLVWREHVAMAMNHIRTLFGPHMVITFIARDPNVPDCYTRLSEERNWGEFILAIEQMGPPRVVTPRAGDTVGNA